jgi:Ca2+-binding EF-hand superfamily protein
MPGKGRFNQSSITFDYEVEKKEEPVLEEEYQGLVEGPPEHVAVLLRQLKLSLISRGARGISGLGRKFRIIDDSNNGLLEYLEFKKAMTEHTMGWTDEQLRTVFDYFDADRSGSIDYDEFLVGVRGNLNRRREQLVLLAFDVMDRDKNGFIELDDIMKIYDASKHPDVLAGKRTKAEVLREFLDTFDAGEKDGKVTPAEFCKYYANISSSIDEDDYFELMIRNAWHISGGTGQSANTTCKRVLVTHEDGRQTVEEIKDDFAMDKNDTAAMRANLAAQGINAKSLETSGSTSGETPKSLASTAPAKGRFNSSSVNMGGFVAPKQETTAPSVTGTSPKVSAVAQQRRGRFNQSSLSFGTAAEVKKEEEEPEVTHENAVAENPDMPPSTALLLEKLRQSLKRHGARGIAGLGRKFKIIDDNNNGQLEFVEFKKACKEHMFDWSEAEVRELFDHFDRDKSGSIDYDEFLVGVRGKLNDRRYQLVLLAFSVLDRDKSGIVEVNDIMEVYDASQHPDVIAGRKTKGEVFREFLDTFDVGDKDGKVTPNEFAKYYANLSASIDDDDYFELMIRNAWHISGGSGQFANTTCKRVLVTHDDGRQTVEEIKDDFAMDKNDTAAMRANLAAQGINVKSIETSGNTSGETPKNSAQIAHDRRGKVMASTPLW